jgi:LysW-gamma-L-lysine carboxypeptidase
MTPDERAAVELLEALVAVPSPSTEETKAVGTLVDWMGAWGLEAGVDEAGNAVGVRGQGEREVLLLGHIDTFPGVVPVRRRGRQLYGRGTVDAKGPLCAFAAAAARVEPPAGWRVTVVGAVEEEISTSRGARHIVGSRTTPPRCCVIGEPSRWDRVTLGYKGCLELHATVRAPFAHSAGPALTPAEHGVGFWNALAADARDRNRGRGSRAFDQLSPTLLALQTAEDGAFGEARLRVGYRLPVSEPPETLREHLATVGRQFAEEADQPGIEVRCTFRGATGAYQGGKSNVLVRAVLAAVRSRGGTPRFVVKTGTSDMDIAGPAWPDTPVVAYGPGDSALDHTPDEHVDLDEYLAATAVLAEALARLWREQPARG